MLPLGPTRPVNWLPTCACAAFTYKVKQILWSIWWIINNKISRGGLVLFSLPRYRCWCMSIRHILLRAIFGLLYHAFRTIPALNSPFSPFSSFNFFKKEAIIRNHNVKSKGPPLISRWMLKGYIWLPFYKKLHLLRSENPNYQIMLSHSRARFGGWPAPQRQRVGPGRGPGVRAGPPGLAPAPVAPPGQLSPPPHPAPIGINTM